ncbi:MAG: thioredoxin family protein [Thermoplasmata archaeon]
MQDSAWSSMGLEILRTKDFAEGHLTRAGTYVVCFGAGWCQPTRRFMPQFVARKGQIPGTLAIADISDRNDPLWDLFQIRITPSIIAFRDGAIQYRMEGRRFFAITPADLDRLQVSLGGGPP